MKEELQISFFFSKTHGPYAHTDSKLHSLHFKTRLDSFLLKTWPFFQKLSPTKLGPYNQTTRHKTPHSSPVFPPPSSTMNTSLPPPEPRGIDHSLLTCGETKCSGHGACKVPPGGGIGFVCDCELGYRGQFCENTVNGALSVTLTLSVLAILIGGLILAFILAKMKQKRNKRKRYQLAEESGCNPSTPMVRQ